MEELTNKLSAITPERIRLLGTLTDAGSGL